MFNRLIVDAMEYKYSFEKLEVWNDARNLLKMIYLQTNNFPDRERFGLFDTQYIYAHQSRNRQNSQ